MFAAVISDDEDKPASAPCVVYWTGRKGLSVKIKTWCGLTRDASDGVLQLPDGTKRCESCERFLKSGRPNVA